MRRLVVRGVIGGVDAHKRRPSKNKEPSVSMKVVMTATLTRGAVS